MAPDFGLDELPEPYGFVADLFEDEVLQRVDDRIVAHVVESGEGSRADQREQLRRAAYNAQLHIEGRIVCGCMEAKGAWILAVATSHAKVVLIDTAMHQVIAQETFDVGETVRSVVLSSDATRQPAPARWFPQLLVALSLVPQIVVYDLHRHAYDTVLQKRCIVCLDGRAAGGAGAERSDPGLAAEQVSAVGTHGAKWVIVLLANRTIRCYLCPTSDVAEQGERGENKSQIPIYEESDEGEEEEGGEEEEEAETADRARARDAAILRIRTPCYTLALPSFVPMCGLPEPDVTSLSLSVLLPMPLVKGRAVPQVPTFCFVHSSESTRLIAYTIPAQTQTFSDMPTPEDPTPLHPRRHWTMPSKISASAASIHGGVFAVGTVRGAVALATVCAGPSLHTTLPGHYGRVTALAFFEDDMLISAGEDGWVQLYDVRTNTVLTRINTPPVLMVGGPAPPTPPVVKVAVSQDLPLAYTLNAEGDLQLIDMLRGQKIARLSCMPAVELAASGATSAGESPQVPRCFFASTSGLCVVCETPAAGDETTGVEGADDETQEEVPPFGEGSECEAEAWNDVKVDSKIIIFDQVASLGVAYQALADCDTVFQKKLFFTATQQELETKRPTGSIESDAIAMTKAKARRPSDAGSSMLVDRSKSPKAAAQPANVARLSKANLRKVLGGPRDPLDVANTGKGAEVLATAALGQQRAHAVPESWIAAAKRQLRTEAEGAAIRQLRCQRSLDQLRTSITD